MQGEQVRGDDYAKRRATAVSLAFNALQSLLKIAAAVVTGSVSVLSEAVHSSTDVVASMMAFVGVRAASAPPDEEHPYGHGKIESLAGFGESILLFCIVVYICAESITRLLHKPTLEKLDLGLVVMTLSAIGCLLVSRYVTHVAKKTKSVALKSNGRHLLADFVTSLGVLAALAGTKLTGWAWLDPAIAIVLALWMCYGAWTTAAEAFQHLIDRRLEDEELAKIQEVVESNPEVLGHHRLRSRLSGDMRYVDMHIVLPSSYSLVQAHAVADELEKKIAFELAPAQVVIHVDPYDEIKALHDEGISRKTDPRPRARDKGH
jgi:cation diffusion facilitator family transporter